VSQVLQSSDGGQYKLAVAAATGAATASATTAAGGSLNRIIFATAGTASATIYDGTNQTAGTLIYTSKTNPVAGEVVIAQIPITTGIFVLSANGSPALCLTYNGAGTNGN
jgi:hypothetical protein